MAKEPFLINPPKSLFKRRARKRAKKRKTHVNPLGESIMLVGANPFERRRSQMMFNPFRKRRHKSRRSRRNPVRRFRRNPIKGLVSKMPMIGAGTVGAVAATALPNVLGLTKGSLTYYGAQAAVVLGGGWAAEKAMGKDVSEGWVIGSAAVILAGIANSLLTSLGAVTAPVAGMAAFPPMGTKLSGGGMGAFPTMSYSGFGEYGDY